MVNHGPEDPDDGVETLQKALTRLMDQFERLPTVTPDIIVMSIELYNALVGRANAQPRPLYASSPFTAPRRERRRLARVAHAVRTGRIHIKVVWHGSPALLSFVASGTVLE